MQHRRAMLLVATLLFGVVVPINTSPSAANPIPGPNEDTVAVTAPPDPPPPVPQSDIDGDIDEIDVVGGQATIKGWALNRTNHDALEVEVILDSQVVATLTADQFRPDVAAAFDRGSAHGFQVTVPVADGGSRVCVFTVPDGDMVACERVGGEALKGVLITPTGVVTPIIEELPGGGYTVFSPCALATFVSTGQVVRTAQIVIDPGHGGRESSTVAFNGLMEKNVNLQVALLVEQILGEAGYSVVLTRTTDLTMPIPTRTEIANTLDPDVFVSIHHNGGAQAYLGRPGTEVFYQHDDASAQRLAGILYEDLYAAALRFPTSWVGTYFDGATVRLHSSGGDFYGIHRRTPNVTSIITEWLWLSNPAEAALLARPDVIEAEAHAIAAGIDRWYRTENQGSGYRTPFVDDYDSGGGGYNGCVDPAFE